MPDAWGAVRLARELARAGVRARVTRVIRGSATVTHVLACPSADVAQLLAPAMAVRLAHALSASDVRLAHDRGRVLVQVTLPGAARRPVPFASLPAGQGMATPIGRDTLGRVVTLDLSDNATPHALVCGTTGAGKSVALTTYITSLARQTAPDALRLLLLDGKGGETFAPFSSLAHLARPVVTDARDATAALAWACDELARRAARGWHQRLVVVVDEVRYILAGAALAHLEQMTAQGRSLGISCVVSTQYASADVLGRLAKADLPARLVGLVDNAQASQLALGIAGLDAHKLSGHGDMIFRGGGAVTRVQVALTAPANVAGLAQRDITAGEWATCKPALQVAEPAPVHPSQAPREPQAVDVAWAVGQGHERGAVPGILAIRTHCRSSDGYARRVRDAALSQASHLSRASQGRTVQAWAGGLAFE